MYNKLILCNCLELFRKFKFYLRSNRCSVYFSTVRRNNLGCTAYQRFFIIGEAYADAFFRVVEESDMRDFAGVTAENKNILIKRYQFKIGVFIN